MIKRANKDEYQTFIEIKKGKPGSIYKLFQDVGAGKGLRKQLTIGSFKSGDSQNEDPNEIANAVNKCFVNTDSKIKEPLKNTSHETLKEFCQQIFLLTPNLLSLILKMRWF